MINSVYTVQSAYNDYIKLVLTGVLTRDFEETEVGTRKFHTYIANSMTDVVIQENELTGLYEELLGQLREE